MKGCLVLTLSFESLRQKNSLHHQSAFDMWHLGKTIQIEYWKEARGPICKELVLVNWAQCAEWRASDPPLMNIFMDCLGLPRIHPDTVKLSHLWGHNDRDLNWRPIQN